MALVDVLNQLDDKTVLNIIRKGLYVNIPDPSEAVRKEAELTKKDLVNISNSLTSLQSAFNTIYTNTLNVKNLQQYQQRTLESIQKENMLETAENISPSVNQMQIEAIDVTPIVDSISSVTKSVSRLADKLEDFNLCKCCDRKSGVVTEIIDEVGDVAEDLVISRGLGVLGKIPWKKVAVGAAVVGAAGAAFGMSSSANAAERVSTPSPTPNGNIESTIQSSMMQPQIPQPQKEPSYSERFADFLDKTIQNVTGWVRSVGSAFGIGGETPPPAGGEIPPNPGVLDSIALAEGTYQSGYNTSLGYGRYLPNNREQNLVGMTLQQILDLGNYMRRQPGNPNSSAMGRYQIVGTTLRNAARALGMDLNTTRFDPRTQDRMAMWIVQNQGFRAWEGFKRNPQYLTTAQGALRTNNLGGYGTGTGNTGRITSEYGMRRHPILGTLSMHKGRDIAAPMNSSVHTARDGTVTHSGPMGSYGNVVEVDHGGNTKTRYAHLSSVSVSRGARVSTGQLIGRVGSTGRSTGAHLHFELLQDGQQINPSSAYSEWIVGGRRTPEGRPVAPPAPRLTPRQTEMLRGYQRMEQKRARGEFPFMATTGGGGTPSGNAGGREDIYRAFGIRDNGDRSGRSVNRLNM